MSDETREPFMQQHFLTPKRIEWPAHLPNVKRQVIAVGMGEVHLLVAVREGGSLETKVYACGHNEHGQLGLGHRDSCSELTHVRKKSRLWWVLAQTFLQRHGPNLSILFIHVKVPFFDDKNITEFACGGKFSLALSIDGKALYSFGRSDLGALGNRFAPLPPGEGDSSNANPEQVKFPTISPIVKISAGINHCLAVTEDNKVYSWGGVRGYVTGFSEYRVFTGPRNYGDGDGPTEYESFPDEDIRAPTHLNLADYSNGSTDCVKVFEACAGDINSLFLVHRMKRADDAGTMDGHQAKKNRTS
jgi:alpha-tubulin suppressor-like RCC1 family protein